MTGQSCPVKLRGQISPNEASSVLSVIDGQMFVRAVMTQLECESPLAFAEKMGWKRGTERLVAKWLAGANRPSYNYIMEMIERTGWLSLDGAPSLRLAATEPSTNELAELRANQTQMLADQKRVIANLESLTTSVEKLVRGIGDQPGEQQQQHD